MGLQQSCNQDPWELPRNEELHLRILRSQEVLAVVVQVLEQIRDLELDRPMTWEGPTAQWQHQQLALAQVMAAKAVNTLPASARKLLDEVERLRERVKELEKQCGC